MQFTHPDRNGCAAIVLGVLTLMILVSLVWLNRGTMFSGPPLVRQGAGAGPVGPGEDPGLGEVPPISDRYFSGGSAPTSVTGDFAVSDEIALDPIGSYAQNGLGWIFFMAGDTEVLIALNEPENSVTVARGGTSVTGIDDDCVFDVEVTESIVAGHVTCADVEVMRDGKPAGRARIEVTFSAES